MKKVLLGTSAIALAGAFATSANAVEWDVRVGGYMESYLAYVNAEVDGIEDEDFDGIDPGKIEAEVAFIPSITLDNGIKIGADIQLEALENDGDQIDEAFLFIDGSFGRVLAGSENSAGYLMHYGAPDVTFFNVNSGSIPTFVPVTGEIFGETDVLIDPDPLEPDDEFFDDGVDTGDNFFRGTLGATYIENGTNNDAQRITYFTPRFAGFQLGVSYARDALQDDNEQLNLDVNDGLQDIFDVGANYVNSFGGIDIAASGRWGIASDDNQDEQIDFEGDDFDDFFDFEDSPQVWGAGLNVGYAGFTIGGSFAEQNNAEAADGTAWDAGIAYETGPWGFSFTYLNGENVDNEAFDVGTFEGDTELAGQDEQLDQYLAGVSYTVAKGVALNGFGAYADFDEDVSDDGTGDGNDVDGWVVGTGIKISW